MTHVNIKNHITIISSQIVITSLVVAGRLLFLLLTLSKFPLVSRVFCEVQSPCTVVFFYTEVFYIWGRRSYLRSQERSCLQPTVI